jgi:hypothetical protein
MNERIIIIGRLEDPSTRLLALRWKDHGARLLTPAGLLVRGWRHDPDDPDRDVAIVDGEPWPSTTITGVVTRLTTVVPTDLAAIRAEDRGYVAAETNAFLLSWLSALPCPVINRPSPFVLCGPAWGAEAWVLRAARLGIPVEPLVRSGSGQAQPLAPGPVVALVGDDVFGDVDDPTLVSHARSLAVEAGTELLELQWSSGPTGPRFRAAGLLPHIDEARAAALLRVLRAAPATRGADRKGAEP